MDRELQTGRTERNQFKISTTENWKLAHNYCIVEATADILNHLEVQQCTEVLSTELEVIPVLTSYLDVDDVRGGVALQVAGVAGVVARLVPPHLLQDQAGAADDDAPAEVLDHLQPLQLFTFSSSKLFLGL